MEHKKIKILIIDDEEKIGQLLKKSLMEIANYEVMTSNDGRDGLLLAKQFQPDAILLDVVMPRISGDEVAYQLLEEPQTAKIPIIFMTGLIREEEANANSQQIGGRHSLAKPLHINQVVEKIKQVLEKK